jgi:hypothetical protein
MREGPRELRIEVEVEASACIDNDFIRGEAIVSKQPIRLVERCSRKSGGARVGNFAEACGMGLNAE